MWTRRSNKMALNERVQGLLLAAEICRQQRPYAPPEECALAIEHRAAELSNEYMIRFDNQTELLHDDGGW